jgi:uncharacterized protein (TIGR03083 family)
MMGTMEIEEHIAALQRDGDLLADAAEAGGLDAAVPTCPPWQVRDLLQHLSYVHRWAAGFVAEQRTERLRNRPSEIDLLSGGPADEDLVSWFRAGHAALVQTLRTADPALVCWTVVPGSSALASWARRQAHETAIHRLDAELAAGSVTPFAADFAADGIDELIMAMFGRDESALTAGQQAGPRQVLQVIATDDEAGHDAGGHGTGEHDTGDGGTADRGTADRGTADRGTGDRGTAEPRAWLVELTADGSLAAKVSRGSGPAGCTLAGPAPVLYQLLWNRCSPGTDTASGAVTISGDAAILQSWRDGMHVRWS